MAIEHDKMAVQALLSRYTTIFNKKKADEKLRNEINGRIVEHQVQMQSFKGAFALFGFDFGDKEIFSNIKKMIGEEAYDEAMYEAAVASGDEDAMQRSQERIRQRLAGQSSIAKDATEEHRRDAASANEQTREHAGGAPEPSSEEQVGDKADQVGELNESGSNTAPRVRDTVLERLKIAGDAGLKAKDIRDFYEATFGVKLHEKTIGMTLYRLSVDGLVRRDGRVWFYVPPEGETKNPGVVAPGSVETVQ
jgi:hypothetical protein